MKFLGNRRSLESRHKIRQVNDFFVFCFVIFCGFFFLSNLMEHISFDQKQHFSCVLEITLEICPQWSRRLRHIVSSYIIVYLQIGNVWSFQSKQETRLFVPLFCLRFNPIIIFVFMTQSLLEGLKLLKPALFFLKGQQNFASWKTLSQENYIKVNFLLAL